MNFLVSDEIFKDNGTRREFKGPGGAGRELMENTEGREWVRIMTK